MSPAPLFTDVVTSLLAQAVVVAGNLAVLRLAASLMEPHEVGEFALVRRVLLFITPLALLGLGVGIPRQLGMQGDERDRAATTAIVGWTLGLTAAGGASLLLGAFPGTAARMFFGDVQAARLVRPLLLLVLGNQGFLLLYATLRGQLRVRQANLLQALHAAVLPVTVMALLGSQGVTAVLQGLGTAAMLGALVLGFPLLRAAWRDATTAQLRRSLQELVAYAVPRVPGDLALTGIYTLGPLLAAHQLDLKAAGMLAIGMSIVSALSAALAPLGLVFLPRMSRALARQGDTGLRHRVPLLCETACYTASFLALAGSCFGNDWMRWILGPRFVLEGTAMLFLAIAAGSNVVFVVLRSLLDAAYFRPLNSLHACVALAVLLAGAKAFSAWFPAAPLQSLCAAIAVSFAVLAALTLLATQRRFGLRLRSPALARWLAIQLLLGGATLLRLRWPEPLGASTGLPLQMGLGMLWVLAMLALRVAWPLEVARQGRSAWRRARRSPAPCRTLPGHMSCSSIPSGIRESVEAGQ